MKNLTTVVLTIALIVAALSSTALVVTIRQSHDRAEDQRIAICRADNELRQILYVEHTKKLSQAKDRLHDALKFLDGRPIPPGFTLEDVRKAISRANDDIALERSVVSKTSPKNCHHL